MKPLVVFKTHSFPNVSETFIVNNITETIKSGYDVIVIVNEINNEQISSQDDIFKKYDLLRKIRCIQFIKNKNYRILKALLYLCSPLIIIYFLKYCMLKKRISLTFVFILVFYRTFRTATVFHVHYADMIEPLFELKKIGFIKSRILVTFHGYDAHYLPKDEKLTSLLQDFKSHIYGITVNSNYLKKKLVKKNFEESKISIIPMGVDLRFFKPKRKKELRIPPFKLITIGRLIELKGQELGIKAVSKLKEKGFDIIYTIVGEGSNYLVLRDVINELNMEDSIYLVGTKSQREIKDLLEEHHIYLMTSVIDSEQRREAFGIVSLEAQAMALPVIGFNSGGFPDTIVENVTGLLATEADVDDLCSKIEQLLEDKDLYRYISNNARLHISAHYSLNKINEEFIKFYYE
jgi:colanic acid/amylovoran/stewartan biosynthesis glycosyltransferase WcaL/AmsK/CpsK